MPVAGITVALFAAAASVSATVLTAAALVGHYSPLHIGLLYLPEVARSGDHRHRARPRHQKARDALPPARRHGLPRRRDRWSSRIKVPSSEALTLLGSGLTGIGLGATVAPALFVAGFSLPSANLQRVFAIVELLRAVAAFMIAPIFVHFAANGRRQPRRSARRIALWIGFGLALGGAARRRRDLRTRRRPPAGPRPRTLPRRASSPAWYSPPLLARVRGAYDHGARSRPKAPTDMAATSQSPDASGPVLFAYDGSELAQLAIEQAGRQLAPGRDGDWSSASGNRQTSDSSRSTSSTSTPRTPAR